jgi:hypothetical protein
LAGGSWSLLIGPLIHVSCRGPICANGRVKACPSQTRVETRRLDCMPSASIERRSVFEQGPFAISSRAVNTMPEAQSHPGTTLRQHLP